MIVVSILFLNFKEQCNYRSIENIKQAAKTIDINFSDTEKKEEVDYQIKVPDQALSYKVFLKSSLNSNPISNPDKAVANSNKYIEL